MSFWDFQEPSGDFVAKQGAGRYALTAQRFDPLTQNYSAGVVERVYDTPPGAPFGPLAAAVDEDHLLVVPDTATLAPLLDIHGDNATLSMVAWMKADPRLRNAKGPSMSYGHLCGIWSEPMSARRYVIFARSPRGQPCRGCTAMDVEVSRTGCSEPPCEWSISYALGSANIEYAVWQMVALTFDGHAIRSFVNGTLDYRAPHRVNPPSVPCNDTWQNPAPVTTWSNRSAWGPGGAPTYPLNRTDFAVGGQKAAGGLTLGHPWNGLIAGLAVYARALTAAELKALAAATNMAI